MSSISWRTGATAALLLLGLAQMAADLFGAAGLRAITAAASASPAPKVFSTVKGLETFSTRFFVEWNEAGKTQSFELTPAAYSRVRGPYNRRNVFGAALAYGPVFAADPRTRPMFESVSRYALCGDATLLAEVGIRPAGCSNVAVRLSPRDGADTGDLLLTIDPKCGPRC